MCLMYVLIPLSHSLLCTSSREVCTPRQTPPSLHSHTLTLKPLLFFSSLNLLPLPPSFHPALLNPSIFAHCHCCAHAGTLWCILPVLVPILLLPPSSLSLNSLCIDASEVPQLVVGHCGRRSQNDSRHSSLPPRLSFLPPSLPRPIILPSFFLATLSPAARLSVLTLGRCRSSCSPLQRRRPL